MEIGIAMSAVTLMGMLGLLVAAIRMEPAPSETEATTTPAEERDLRRAA